MNEFVTAQAANYSGRPRHISPTSWNKEYESERCRNRGNRAQCRPGYGVQYSMSDPVHAWLAAQRDLTERWLSASPADAAHTPAQDFWKKISAQVSPQARELATELMQLGPAFFAGTTDALSDLFGVSAAQKNESAPFGRWLDLAPIGYFREYHAQAQELTRALEEYARISTQMAESVARIHMDALERLAKRAQELQQGGTPIADTRRLYDLWIECGEQAFAHQAGGEAFGKMQGALVNAATRVRIAQQTIAGSFLKSLDLPTRGELNSVHKRLKDMRERIEQLEDASNSQARGGEKHP
jgi:hypothetical protein